MKNQWKTNEGNHATNTTQNGRQIKRMKNKWETSKGNQPDTECETSGRQIKNK